MFVECVIEIEKVSSSPVNMSTRNPKYNYFFLEVLKLKFLASKFSGLDFTHINKRPSKQFSHEFPQPPLLQRKEYWNEQMNLENKVSEDQTFSLET